MLAQTLGARLAERRKEINMTQGDVAEALGVDPETVSRFERGTHLPSLLTLQALSTVLKIKMASLLSDEPVTPSTMLGLLAHPFSQLSQPDQEFVYRSMLDLCGHLNTKTKQPGTP